MVDLVLRNPDNGKVVFRSSTITAHIRGSFVAGSGGGEITIPGLSDYGNPFVLSAVPINGTASSWPVFQIQGNKVLWSSSTTDCRVIMASNC